MATSKIKSNSACRTVLQQTLTDFSTYGYGYIDGIKDIILCLPFPFSNNNVTLDITRLKVSMYSGKGYIGSSLEWDVTSYMQTPTITSANQIIIRLTGSAISSAVDAKSATGTNVAVRALISGTYN
jgi:hypothetical protein